MGARAQVKVEMGYGQPAVYLYTHWGASVIRELVEDVVEASNRKSDPEYLARQIFCAMVGHDVEGETGFGIGSSEHGDLDHLVVVEVGGQVRLEY